MAKRFSRKDPKVGDTTDIPEAEVVARFIYEGRKFYVEKRHWQFIVVEIVDGTPAREMSDEQE